MATVYRADDLRHGRTVAIKVLAPGIGDTERFEREVQVSARLQHPGIVPLFDSGSIPEFHGPEYPASFYVMPFVEGDTLRHRLAAGGPLDAGEAVRIAGEVADALDYAHREGVVHRDIKPENILLSQGHALIADFGIARAGDTGALTVTGTSIGTPAYMSPEQAAGDRQVDGRSDVYSLGCVLYEMLAGEPPFVGATVQAVIAKRLAGPAPLVSVLRPATPTRLAATIARALERSPADRFATAGEFTRALRAAATPVPAVVEARPGRWAPWAAAAAVALAAMAVIIHQRSGAADGAGDTAPDAVRRIAVLPFENRGDSADAYFADGMTDEVRTRLASIPGVEVIARTSAERYRGTAEPPEQIARELGVRYLLTATVRWDRSAGANRVRLSPELVEVAGNHAPTSRWQQTFDAVLKDIFQVQGEIAAQVAENLQIALASNDREMLEHRPTSNLAAYDAYLKAGRDQPETPAGLRQTAALLERAVSLDSTFARAWAFLSGIYARQYGDLGDLSAKDRTFRAASRAVALDSTLPEAWAALARYYWAVSFDWNKAAPLIHRGLALDPNNLPLLSAEAERLRASGHDTDAVAVIRRTTELDPRRAGGFLQLAVAEWIVRRYAAADSAVDRGTALGTPLFGHWVKASIAMSRGDLHRARAALATVATDDDLAALANSASYFCLEWAFSPDQRQRILQLDASALGGNRMTWAVVMAETWMINGDTARARAYGDSSLQAEQLLPPRLRSDVIVELTHAWALALAGRLREAQVQIARARGIAAPVGGDPARFTREVGARISMMAGRRTEAIAALDSLLQQPGWLSPARLRIDPTWTALRGEPAFQALLAQPPKVF
jgi:serine/threonine-protein kinase